MSDGASPLADLVTVASIRDAAERIAPHVHRTPLLRCASLDRITGCEIHLKVESWQKTGSFKPRGALNRLAHMGGEEARRGVLAASAGNHAQGLAYAATARGIPVKVVMPANTPRPKIEAARAMGADVVLHGEIFDDALERSLEIGRSSGMIFVHPCTDPLVISGAGTVGLEICDQLPSFDAIVCPVGGGGLITGVGTVVREMVPGARVYGVNTEAAPAMARSFREGRAVTVEASPSIAEGMAGKAGVAETLEVMKGLLEDVVTVSERGILEAILLLLTRAKLLVEGAGAGPLAALLERRIPVRPGARVVLILSGGNLDVDRLAEWVLRRPPPIE